MSNFNGWNITDKVITPPEHVLQPTDESKRWISDLGKAGIIFEQTGQFQPLRNILNVGMVKGFVSEAYRYKNNKVEVMFHFPQCLTEAGEREQEYIVQWIYRRNISEKYIYGISGIFGALSAVFFMWGITLLQVMF